MKQEDKELLLKDLCARLPYGVKIHNEIQGDFEIYGICAGYIYGRSKTCHIDFSIEKIKPYLRPMSSMTEEQKEEYESLCIKNTSECTDLYDIIFPKDYYDTVESIDYLYKNHIDVRSLISMGLAIDCTNLNIY